MTNAQIVDDTPALDVRDPRGVENVRIVVDAIEVIDKALSQMVKRELVSSVEVSDLLLDVRNLLSAAAKEHS